MNLLWIVLRSLVLLLRNILIRLIEPKYKGIKFVVVESPFAGEIEKNLAYARKCMRDCIKRQEFPFASHLLYTQEGILDDNVPEERLLGIFAGLLWTLFADKTVVYKDLGLSSGMLKGIDFARRLGRDVEYRTILEEPDEKLA